MISKMAVCVVLTVLFFVCVITLECRSQSLVEIKYEETVPGFSQMVNGKVSSLITPRILYMYFNDSFALACFELFSPARSRRGKVIGDKLFHHAVFHNFISGERFREVNWPEGNKYLIRDTLTAFNWQFFTEQKTILKTKCSLAISVTATNDSVLVWYSTEFGRQRGTLFYDNIPGVVLEVCDQVRNVHITAIKMRERKIQLAPPNQGILVSFGEYRKIHETRDSSTHE